MNDLVHGFMSGDIAFFNLLWLMLLPIAVIASLFKSRNK